MSRLQQNFAQLIMYAGGHPKPNLVQIHPLGRLGIWVKYNVFVPFLFIYLYLFSETRVDGFLQRGSSLDVKSRKDVPFRGYKT